MGSVVELNQSTLFLPDQSFAIRVFRDALHFKYDKPRFDASVHFPLDVLHPASDIVQFEGGFLLGTKQVVIRDKLNCTLSMVVILAYPGCPVTFFRMHQRTLSWRPCMVGSVPYTALMGNEPFNMTPQSFRRERNI